jgi:hypothetical protein
VLASDAGVASVAGVFGMSGVASIASIPSMARVAGITGRTRVRAASRRRKVQPLAAELHPLVGAELDLRAERGPLVTAELHLVAKAQAAGTVAQGLLRLRGGRDGDQGDGCEDSRKDLGHGLFPFVWVKCGKAVSKPYPYLSIVEKKSQVFW